MVKEIIIKISSEDNISNETINLLQKSLEDIWVNKLIDDFQFYKNFNDSNKN